MMGESAVRAKSEQLFNYFQAAGAQPVETDILQPADTLLDLYGEDIRGRAYVTSDPLQGEVMLRPDFTVPVVRMHMQNGAEPARYTYMGKVFRAQEHEMGRDNEYFQVGYEVFDGTDPVAADAEVFALIAEALLPLKLRAATGDFAVLLAAVNGLNTTDRRKAALRRHLWRPRRFRALLDRFGGRKPEPESRVRMLAEATKDGVAALMDRAGPEVGLRSRAEVEARIAALQEDAAAPAISAGELEILDTIIGLRETAPNALEHLRDIAVDLPSILPAVQRIERRLTALDARGIDVSSLDFEASYGRTTMEYYDGFVFGFYAETRPDLPPVASGGRYDALTRVLGQGRSIPAVGGVIRPAEVLTLTEGAQ
ncbi:ATP phosphoribosyltransferase regulatory subunit [Actibacterium sp. XHP0104]|uniref:ATP phosphoribosyltransferase regulatory subunit n=1 Tax=Actibacterium sp. XHP0104 TaxID=2984335 RepID=UPI0021E928A3|nr:ATP phosphoribosyltransferase regulatory subunit [Actibacterium sp. XHP0104]MCV2882688.1 ATP phosphoribosyltransferase regulatory subunit [Actibacterium sp. XHP0104]